MRDVTLQASNLTGNGQKIGAALHSRRNRWLLVALAVAGVLVAAYYSLLVRQDEFAVSRLEKFRAAYAQKCNAPQFAEATSPMLKELYLGSSTLQAAVDRQLVALEGGGSCEVVSKALRAADFPVPGL